MEQAGDGLCPLGPPRRRKAAHNLRIDLCVHRNPVMGSPTVASRSSSSSAGTRPGVFFRPAYGPRPASECDKVSMPFGCRNSLCPRWIVVRLNPVMTAPHLKLNK